jgi:hypothetical protein
VLWQVTLKEYNINTSNAYIEWEAQQQVQLRVDASLMEAPCVTDEGKYFTAGT